MTELAPVFGDRVQPTTYLFALRPRRTPSWSGMAFTVPWTTLALVFVALYAVALGTTYLPARRAGRIYPAEALRYQ
jgi:ABC-type antimicrobial peptide transport system permease subunit